MIGSDTLSIEDPTKGVRVKYLDTGTGITRAQLQFLNKGLDLSGEGVVIQFFTNPQGKVITTVILI